MEYFKLIPNLSKNPKALDFDFITNYDELFVDEIFYNGEVSIEEITEFEIEVDLDCGIDELDYNFSNQGIVIISEKMKTLIEKSEAKFIKTKVLNHQMKQNYYVIIIKNFYDCVDETKSEYYPADNILKKNKYKNLNRYYIDSTKVGNSRIFRLEKYFPQIIITEDLKRIFEENKITGIEYNTTWE